MRHSGTEYCYLISGELELNLGFDKYVLAAGDSVCFESTKPHGYRNDGESRGGRVVRRRAELTSDSRRILAADLQEEKRQPAPARERSGVDRARCGAARGNSHAYSRLASE